MPEPRPMPPRADTAAGDTASLVRLGLVDPPPIPESPPDPAPAPDPVPDPGDAEEEAELTNALLGIGIEASAEDRAAVKALASLDAATVDAVSKWLTHKKTRPDTEK